MNILQIAKQVFNDEITSIQHLSTTIDNNFEHAILSLFTCSGKIIVMGMGKSGHIARKIAATLASTGSPAFFIHPTEALHGDLGMIGSNDVIIAISYSGESDELVQLIPHIKLKQNIIVAITGNITSSLAKLSHHVISIAIDKEACQLNLAPTTSTTATLIMGDAIAICLSKLKDFQINHFAQSHPGGNLGRKLLTTNKHIMHVGNNIPKVCTNTNLKAIILEISQKKLGFTAVVDENEYILGIITDGDLRRLLHNLININLTEILAINIMTKNPKLVFADELAVKSVELISQYKITGLLVVNDCNQLVGALSLHDLFKAKLL